MAVHFAAIVVTSRIVHEALALPGKWENPVRSLWCALTSEVSEADRPAAALHHVWSWAVANRDSFYCLSHGERRSPPNGWLGRWDDRHGYGLPTNGKKAAKWVGVLSHILKKSLRDGGFEPEAVIRAWRDRGWIEVNTGSSGECRYTLRVKIGKPLAHVIAIKRATIKELGFGWVLVGKWEIGGKRFASRFLSVF